MNKRQLFYEHPHPFFFFLALCLSCGLFSLFPTTSDLSSVSASETLQNPRIEKDSSMASGQRVTWNCVYFGSYPQSEVVEKDSDHETRLKK